MFIFHTHAHGRKIPHFKQLLNKFLKNSIYTKISNYFLLHQIRSMFLLLVLSLLINPINSLDQKNSFPIDQISSCPMNQTNSCLMDQISSCPTSVENHGKNLTSRSQIKHPTPEPVLLLFFLAF